MSKILPVVLVLALFIVFFGMSNSWTAFAQNISSDSAEIQNNNNQSSTQLIYAPQTRKLTLEEKNSYCLSIYKQLKDQLNSLIQNYSDMTTRVTNIYDQTVSFYNKYLKSKEPIETFDTLSLSTANDKKNVLLSLQSLKTESDNFSCNDLPNIKNIDTYIDNMKESYINYNKNTKELLLLIQTRYIIQKNLTQQK